MSVTKEWDRENFAIPRGFGGKTLPKICPLRELLGIWNYLLANYVA